MFQRESDAVSVYESLVKLALPRRIEDLYAFVYKPDFDASVNGWALYNAEREYARMGVPNELWTLTPENNAFQVCGNGAGLWGTGELTLPPYSSVPHTLRGCTCPRL